MSKVGAVVVSAMLEVAHPAKVQPASAQVVDGDAVGKVIVVPEDCVSEDVAQLPLPGLKLIV